MQRDRLKYTANLIGVSLLLFTFTNAVLHWLGSFLINRFFEGASFENPVGVPEVLVQGNYLLYATVPLCIAIIFLKKFTARKKNTSLFQNADATNPLPFVLAFLGVIPVTSLLSGLFERALSSWVKLESVRPFVFPKDILATVILFIYMCIVPAVLEEVLFRGYMQKMLMPYGAVFAIAVTSALFMLMHARFYEMPSIFLLSMVLGYTAFLQKGIKTSILLHFINNAFAFATEYAIQNIEGTAAITLVTVLFAICAVLGFFSLLILRNKERAPLHTNTRPDRITRAEKMLSAPFFTFALVVICITLFLR